MVHDELGHNGTHRTYILLKRLYYWKGLKPSVEKHIKRCYQCQRRNRQVVKYARLHFDVATFPMQFISMHLIREFHPPTNRKHRYALTVICMLTGYILCVPLQTKTAEEVIQAYIDQIYSRFGGSLKILSDNGTEFKNKLFEQVAKELGVEYKLYTLSSSTKWPNRRISCISENLYSKACCTTVRMGCTGAFGLCCLQFHS